MTVSFQDVVKRMFREVLIIIGLSVVAGVIVNFLSPNGIAFVGQWDVSKGVVSARKMDEMSHAREIERVNDAFIIYQKKAALFVDARDGSVFSDGHIQGAISFPVNEYEDHIEAFLNAHPPDEVIVVYCSGRLCEDSHNLAEFLVAEGYQHISVFIDGFEGWEENGFPIETNASLPDEERDKAF